MSAGDGHLRLTYNDVHRLIGNTASKIQDEFSPDIMIAIGGGGFFPARVLRTFLKNRAQKNIPIQAIGLSLYEELGSVTNGDDVATSAEKIGKEVIRTQWLDFSTLGQTCLLGRKILIVDEVDDTRTTLSYAVQELEKDLANQRAQLKAEDRERFPPTQFAIFVVHNKDKPKASHLPDYIKYFAGAVVGDLWVDYPWEVKDIDEHDRLAKAGSC